MGNKFQRIYMVMDGKEWTGTMVWGATKRDAEKQMRRFYPGYKFLLALSGMRLDEQGKIILLNSEARKRESP